MAGLILALSAGLARPAPAEAWSRKGHVLILRSAVQLLVDDVSTPAALRTLLLEGLGDPARLDSLDAFVLTEPYSAIQGPLAPGLEHFSFRPDDLGSSPVAVFGSTEDRMHYLGLERFHPDPERRKYAPDGSNRPAPADLPRDWHDERYARGGLLTFRVEQVYNSVVQSLAAGSSNEQVFLWMGFLSHYASDTFQPFHATLNFDGLQCPANQSREKGARHNLHYEFEDRIFSDGSPEVRSRIPDFWKQYRETLSAGGAGPRIRRDPYVSAQEALLGGYDLLPVLCRAAGAALKGPDFDRAAWFAYSENLGGRRFSVAQLEAERMALAALAVRDLFRQAWFEAFPR